MSELTQEEIAVVAKEVMGYDFPMASFAPAFDNGLFYRSQALACVRGIADKDITALGCLYPNHQPPRLRRDNVERR